VEAIAVLKRVIDMRVRSGYPMLQYILSIYCYLKKEYDKVKGGGGGVDAFRRRRAPAALSRQLRQRASNLKRRRCWGGSTRRRYGGGGCMGLKAQGKFDLAMQQFSRCANSESAVGLYGLAQMYIRQSTPPPSAPSCPPHRERKLHGGKKACARQNLPHEPQEIRRPSGRGGGGELISNSFTF
jgi:hypothetical protein